LVVQPWDGTQFADAAIHLGFALTPEQGKALRSALRDMKAACSKDTTTANVGIHPCLQGSGADEFFATSVKPLILAHAGVDRLAGVASMVTVPGIEWHWRGFAKVGENLVQFPALPRILPQNVMTFRQDGSYDPEPTTVIGLGDQEFKTALIPKIIQKSTLEGTNAPSKEEFRQAILAAYAAENPRLSRLPHVGNPADLNSVGVTDCASCHVQSPALIRIENNPKVKAKFFDEDLEAAISEVKYPAPLRNTQSATYAVINFGFLFTSESVNRRTHAETLDAVEKIKEIDGQ
jgi:hypothetical protein